MGKTKNGGDKATMSELRVRRLLACDEMEELYTLLRRALHLLNNRLNLANLASILWHWSPIDEQRPNDPRRQLAYEYYSASPLN